MSKFNVFNRCYGLLCCIVPEGCIPLTGRLNPAGRHFFLLLWLQTDDAIAHSAIFGTIQKDLTWQSIVLGLPPGTFYTGQEGYFVTISYN